VADATYRTDEEPDLRTSLLRNLGGAVGLVVLMAAVFGGLGMIGRDDTPTPVAAEGPAGTADEGEDVADDTPDEDAADADVDPAEADADDAAEPEPEPEPEATEDGDAAEDDDAAGEDDAAAEDDDAATDDGTQDADDDAATPAIPPGDISIQVLDGYKTDGGAAARSLASTLRDRGYRVVAENQALNYERTTVLWTAGNEAAARQVAADIGAADVREQPGNLSSSVDVHVVVGADRG
jgi:hypothetical protein